MAESKVESAQVPPRLRKFAAGLWLDPDEIIGVKSFNDRGTYNRMVEIYLRNGETHRITAVYSSGSELVSVGDEKRDWWLSEHLSDLVGDTSIPPGQVSA